MNHIKPSIFPGSVREPILYLVGFADGTVKVGKTMRPRTRLAEHRASRRLLVSRELAPLAWAHAFLNKASGRHEACVIAEFAAVGRQIGRTEYFDGISKAQCIALCRLAISGADASTSKAG